MIADIKSHEQSTGDVAYPAKFSDEKDVTNVLRLGKDGATSIEFTIHAKDASTGSRVNDGMRIVRLCATQAALDQPTRIRAEITVRATYRKKEYTVKKKVLLHSMPFRQIQSP